MSGNWDNPNTWSPVGVPQSSLYDSAVISTGNTVTLTSDITVTGDLTIEAGGTLDTANHQLTLAHYFTNGGTLAAGSSNIIIGGSIGDQSIGGFITTGTVSMTKTGGVATFTGDVTAGGLVINGAGGTLNLGAGLTHTITTSLTLTNGTLNGGSSTLNFSGSSATITSGTFTGASGTINYNAGGNQTVAPLTYNNLTLSASGNKTTTGVTVNGTLSMEGTAADWGTAPTFGPAAALKYNTSTARTAGNEWRTPFNGTGGIIIANTGVITLTGDHTLGNSVPLIINPLATLAIGNISLSTGGDIDNNGSLNLTSTRITLTGTVDQNIDGFTTLGTFTISKTGGRATLLGNVIANGLILNGSGGTLNLGTGLTHTINGSWTMTAGTLEGGTNTLNVTGNASGSGATFIPGMSTVNYSGGGDQSVGGFPYYHLIISTSGIKSTVGPVTINGNLTVNTGTTFTIAGYNVTVAGSTTVNGTISNSSNVGTKTFIGPVTVNGSWTNPGASNIHFQGGLTHNGTTFSAGNGIYFFETNDQSIGGTSLISVNYLTVNTITLTNNGRLTVNNNMNGSGSLVQGAGATLDIAGTISLPFTATAVGNTVNYSDTIDQSVLAQPYYHLGTGSSGVKTLAGDVTISGDLTVGAGTTFIIPGYTITVLGSTMVNGTLTHSNAAGIKTFTGLVTISSGTHDWINTANADIHFKGGLLHNGRNFTAGTGTYYFETNDQSIGGTTAISLANATVTGITLTNTGTLTVTTALIGTGTLEQGANATLSIAGTPGISALTASVNPNTVNYTGGGQTVIPTTYHHLGLSGSGVKVLAGITAINGNLSMSNSVSASTVNNVAIGGNLTLSNTAALTINGFDFSVAGNTTLSGSSSLTHIGAAGVKTYTGNVNINSGTTWFDNDAVIPITFGGDLVNNGTLNAGTGVHTFTGTGKAFSGVILIDNVTINGSYTNNGTLTVGVSLAGAGSLTQGAPNPTLKIGGTLTLNSLTATANPNTVWYTKNGSQTIRGMTYHHLQTYGTAIKTLDGAIIVNGDLTIGAGTTLDVSGADYPIKLIGSWNNNGTFTSAGGTVTLQGTTAQTLNGGATTFNNLVVDNAAGVTLNASETVNGALTLTNGKVNTGSRTLTLGQTATISGADASHYINGNLQKMFPTGAQSFVYDVGDASVYTPVTLDFANFTTSGGMTVKSAAGEPSNISTSGIDPSLDVNRNWTLTPSGGLAPINYNATFTFVEGDKDAGVNTDIFIVKKNTGSWGPIITSTSTSVSTQATGITQAVGQVATFAIGQPDTIMPVVTNVYSSKANGIYKAGVVIANKVTFNKAVIVTGNPLLTLETGATDRSIAYSGGNGTNELTFNYTILAGDVSPDLDYVSSNSLTLNNGTILDGAAHPAILDLPTPGEVGSLGANAALVIDAIAPTTTIDSMPPNPDNDLTPIFIFSGDGTGSEVASFQCKLDSGIYAVCSTPFTTPSLSGGSHTFYVYAVDQAGNNDATPATYTWMVDNSTPDTTLTSTPSNPDNDPTPHFEFSGTGATEFRCVMDGNPEFACTSPLDHSPALPDGEHTFSVYAINGVGNFDPTPASYTWRLDATPPNTTITGHPNSPSSNQMPLFTFSGTDGTGTGVASYQCKIDEGSYIACTSAYTTPSLEDGPHAFYVRALDAAGNTDLTPDSYAWMVDATPPETYLDSMPPSLSNDATPTFTFHGMDGFGSGVAMYECNMDGGSFSVCTSGLTWSALANGSHTFSVRTIDQAGNADATPAIRTWLVDATPPDTFLDSMPPNPDNSKTPAFTFHGTDAGGSGLASYECKMDNGSFSTCISGDSWLVLVDGSHTFSVRAIDQAGNADGTPAIYTWTISTTTGYKVYLPVLLKP